MGERLEGVEGMDGKGEGLDGEEGVKETKVTHTAFNLRRRKTRENTFTQKLLIFIASSKEPPQIYFC